MVEIIGGEILTRFGFNEKQAGQLREQWNHAVENIGHHGSRMAAKIIASNLGSIVLNQGANFVRDFGRLFDPRKSTGYEGVIGLFSSFGFGRPGYEPPPPGAALIYTGADILSFTANLVPVAVTAWAVYEHGKPFAKGVLNAIGLGLTTAGSGAIKTVESLRGKVTREEMALEFLKTLQTESGRKALQEAMKNLLPPQSKPE